jgi:hypothetical protein
MSLVALYREAAEKCAGEQAFKPRLRHVEPGAAGQVAVVVTVFELSQ